MGTGERNFPGVAAKGREIRFHVPPEDQSIALVSDLLR